MAAAGAGAGAVSTGAGTEIVGRLFTKNGAITTGASTKITAPTENSSLDFGSLSTFAMWSSAGGVSDVATAETTGDVGNVSGILSMTGTHVGRHTQLAHKEDQWLMLVQLLTVFIQGHRGCKF